jgi:hypothetical protein
MPVIPLATNYLAASLLTLILPLALLIALLIWYFLALRRVPEDTPASSPSLPSREMVAAASSASPAATPPPAPAATPPSAPAATPPPAPQSAPAAPPPDTEAGSSAGDS